MKTFAIFLFDDNKKGFERYTYLRDAELAGGDEQIEQMARIIYCDTFLPEQNEKVYKLAQTIKATTWDARITINDVRFASQTVAYIPRNGGKAIVLAERIK